MKVFMSWSGARSKAAAELLHDWIKCVIQASKPWISTRGIGRGAVWFSEINNELKDTTVGIICLTHQNKSAPWILFEAGALAKGLTTTKVCTFLVDLSPTDIQDPLAQFNHTMPNREGMMSLAATLNSALTTPLDNSTLTSVFEAFWPQFERDYAQLLNDFPQEVVVEARSETSLLEEILESTRGLAQRMRAIEDRQVTRSTVETKPAVAWPFPSSNRAEREDSIGSHATEIEMRGIAALKQYAAQGMPRELAYKRLARKYGTDNAVRIIDVVESLSPPIVFAAPE